MDDQFLHDLRRAPPPEFAARLLARLHAQRPGRGERWHSPAARWLAAAAAVTAVGFAFTFPDVRAGAEAFLDLFRVVNFAGVPFDPQRLADLKAGGVDLSSLLGDIEPRTAPAAPVSYASPVEAGQAAGIRVRLPAWVPPGWTLAETTVTAEHSVRITAHAAKLQSVLDALALNDVHIPEGLDGQVATVHVPPVVGITYRNGDVVLRLTEARSPEAAFPAGFDVPALAQVALRILGLDRDEAYRMAYGIDWRNTLIVAVPVDAASFRQVDVAGAAGLLVERARGRMLLWSSGGQVYALLAPLGAAEVLEMAQSLQ